ncbi:MAG: head GIN domain-containing protein [Ferruginibacter sp.]
MKLLFSVLCFFVAFSGLAQKTAINDPNAKTRVLKNSFSSVSVSDGIKLYLSEGNKESIAISFSDSKYEERFKTIVTDGVLKIYFDNNGLNWKNEKRNLKAYVSFKTLKKLNASGGADVIIMESLNQDDLEMQFTSGSRFKGTVNAKNLDIKQSSGSDMELSGTVNDISISSSSGSMFNSFDLTVNSCTAKATSGAAIKISISKELNASANSGGAIRFKGDGVIKEVNVNSGGSVKRS